MGKNRYINTSFWDDEYIMDLSAKDKLLFLYLLTSPLNNISGMYEIHLRRIIFDTGLQKQEILKALKGFERNKKVFFVDDKFIVIANFIKHQKLNVNIQKGIVNCVNSLPVFVKSFLGIELIKPFKSLLEIKKALNYININSNLNLNTNINLKVDIDKELSKPQEEDLYRKFAHLELTQDEYSKLIKYGMSKQAIDDLCDKVENYSKNKNYKSLYLTILSWYKKQELTDKPEKKGKRKDDIDVCIEYAKTRDWVGLSKALPKKFRNGVSESDKVFYGGIADKRYNS